MCSVFVCMCGVPTMRASVCVRASETGDREMVTNRRSIGMVTGRKLPVPK